MNITKDTTLGELSEMIKERGLHLTIKSRKKKEMSDCSDAWYFDVEAALRSNRYLIGFGYGEDLVTALNKAIDDSARQVGPM